MEEIKSIRVRDRDKFGFDYKLSLFRDKNKRKILIFNEEGDYQLTPGSGGPLSNMSEVVYGSKYKDYPNGERVTSNSNQYNGLIGAYLNQMIGLGYLSSNYRVIQDPWTNITPKERAFGFDPYYLNNGSYIYIDWIKNNISVGGEKWSDDLGNELDTSTTGETKDYIYKYAKIWNPEGQEVKVMVLFNTTFYNYNGFENNINYDTWNQQWKNGNPKDIFLIERIIEYWKNKVPNYNLELCNPSNERCNVIPYISPIDPPPPTEPPVDNTPPAPVVESATSSVVEETVVRSGVTFDVTKEGFFINAEFGELRIVNPGLDGFDFGDDFEDLDLLDEQFTEGEFSGLEEESSVLEEQEYPSESVRIETLNQSQVVNNTPYVPGKYVLDLIPGEFLGNNKIKVKCCQIDGKPVSIKIADAVLDMKAAAKKDGVDIILTSGFRPDYYPNVNAKSEKGVKVTAQSQEELYQQNCVNKGGKCSPATAKPGNSKHGSGIAIDLNTGSRTGKIRSPLNEKVYTWLIKNSWRFGFVRTVGSEEWHFEYWKDVSGPYAKVSKNNSLFYADLGLNNISVA